jgi:hypothetical protein
LSPLLVLLAVAAAAHSCNAMAPGSGSGGAIGSGGRAGAGAGGDSGAGGGADAGAAGGAGGGGTGGMPAAADLLALTRTCGHVVSSHRYATDDGATSDIDICSLNGAVFWTADMDVDCDGRNVGDGKCPGDDCCYQPQTAITNASGDFLAASVTPYVVIPGDFSVAGLKDGTVVAVIYGGKVQYAVFGDTGPNNIIGEASYACAAALGIDPDPGHGGTDAPVTYIAFTGTATVPANIEDQTATRALGERLAAQLLLSN